MEYINAPTQAPKGGAVSPLNGEFYKGGQFMCNQFDMPKGYIKHLKRAVEKRTSKTQNIALITVTAVRVLVLMAGEKRQECVFSGSIEQCSEFARQLIAAKAAQAEREGVMVHPTELVFA
jgi:hypothetical protein